MYWKSKFLYQYRPEGIFRNFFGLILDPPRYICFYSEKRQIHLYRPFFFSPWHGLFRKIGRPQMRVWPQLVFRGSPPHPPLQLEDPSFKPKPFPPRPLPPSSPHPPWLFLQCSGSPGRGGPVWCRGGVLGGVEGEGPPAVLGARPTSRSTRKRGGLVPVYVFIFK